MTALDFYIDGLKDKGFSDKKIKELTEHRDLPLLQFAEDYHNKQLLLHNVSQQRELLVDFWMNLPNTNKNKSVAKHYVDKYLESTNCG